MKSTISIKDKMVKGGIRPKISQISNSNRHMSIDSTKPGSFLLEGNEIKTDREFENIVTSRKSKAYDFSMATMDNDYGDAHLRKHELNSELSSYQRSMQTYDVRSKERLKNQISQFIDYEYDTISDRRQAEIIKLQSLHEVRKKDEEIYNLKKIILDKNITEKKYKEKLKKYQKINHKINVEFEKSQSRYDSHSSLNNSFIDVNKKKIEKVSSPYSSHMHSIRRSNHKKN